jgi:hypothetical protein
MAAFLGLLSCVAKWSRELGVFPSLGEPPHMDLRLPLPLAAILQVRNSLPVPACEHVCLTRLRCVVLSARGAQQSAGTQWAPWVDCVSADLLATGKPASQEGPSPG